MRALGPFTLAVLVSACTPAWVLPPEPPGAESLEAAIRRGLTQAKADRELDALEALEPGTRARQRAARLATGTLADALHAGEGLFFLDTPWRPETGKAQEPGRCAGCHHGGGTAGSGGFTDLRYEPPPGSDDLALARRRLPPMLAGAALLELAAEGPDAVPFGATPGRPRTLAGMVEWSVREQLGAAASPEELDALEAFIAQLPVPRHVPLDRDSLTERAARGAQTFEAFGCAACHVAVLPVRRTTLRLTSGRVLDVAARVPRDVEGRPVAPLYSDLRVHELGPELKEADGNTRFVTRPLWGVASRSVFLHDGRTSSLDEAIRLHGGEAASARQRYLEPERPDDALALRVFLLTLGRVPAAERSR
ncbi:MAG: hypothetical protein K1X89_28410 [Myxococcaceae bacterium]|nr:hypothetical protein [Myxococcaceae bacterium]